MAHAEVADADRDNLYGEWSDLVTGEKPAGLISAYLVSDGDLVRVAALWESREAHDLALHEEKTHPAFRVFEAGGSDAEHAVMNVVGSIG